MTSDILKWEGSEAKAHVDPKGIPTYGPGYALVVRGSDSRYLPRPKAEIEATVGGAEFIG